MTTRQRLFALEHFGIKLGLDNIRALAAALGHPERAYPCLHIAGTNGKGSTAAMTERALRAAGHRTGLYTSPHLDRIEERFQVDGTVVAPEVFEAVTLHVLALVDAALADRRLSVTPTFFEVTTAIGFELFRRAAVDVAVIEVGLGGRFDATNILTPAVCGITSIAFDHERHLGTTLSAIAFEKAGIAKPDVPLVVGAVGQEAHATIAGVAAEREAPLVDAAAGTMVEMTMTGGHATVNLTTPVRHYAAVRLALAGRHQVENACVAVRMLEVVASRGIAVDEDAIVTGLRDARWPARLEWLRTAAGDLLMDAAHNPAGVAALASYLHDAAAAPLPIVIAVMQDKDIANMIRPLAAVASAFVATEASNTRSSRAADLATALARFAPGVPVIAEPDPHRALARAFALGSRVAVAGSIYLVGPLRAQLVACGAEPI